MLKVPFKAKFAMAYRAIGLSSADIAILDTILSKAKDDPLWSLVLPEGITSTCELAEAFSEKGSDILSLLPSETLPVISSILTSPGGKAICASALCKVVDSFDEQAQAIIHKVADSVASAGLISDQTEFESLTSFISDAVIPYVAPLIEESSSSREDNFVDGHADLICKCPKCEYIFIPIK